MKKIFTLLLITFIFLKPCFSQTMATLVSFNKSNEPALMLELPYNEDVTEDFIIANLKKTGYNPETKGKLFWKQNKVNGYYVFKGVMFEGSKEVVDLYFRVEQKSRKEKDHSIIYLLIGKGEDNFISSESDQDTYVAGKRFLDNFINQSAEYKLDLDIKAQENAVKNAEKKLADLQDDEKSLTKKLEQLQETLKKNKDELDVQQKVLENERKKLAALKEKAA
jgi:hypothetical protein